MEIRSKTEEEATKKAIEQLNVNKDDIENIKVEVIEEPNKGFLGFIGAKDGLYKITVTEKVEIIEEVEPVKEIDIENYREKREQSLIRYANKVAREVAKTKKTKKLDYMNPYERRIIHSALQNDKYVITYSEGEEPHRRLVIEYKR